MHSLVKRALEDDKKRLNEKVQNLREQNDQLIQEMQGIGGRSTQSKGGVCYA